MIKGIFTHSDYLEKALDASWLRNEVISNNIANVDTPNFKSSAVKFESIFNEAITSKKINAKKTNPRHLDFGKKSIEPVVVKRNDTANRMDGNNVDIESEQIDLVKNVIYYNTLIEKYKAETDRIRAAINEGK